MGKLIQRKNLTPEQYQRANFVMCLILSISYVAYIIVDLINHVPIGIEVGDIIRCVVYLLAFVASVVVYQMLKRVKKCMIIFSIIYLVTYAILVFGNGVVVMMLVFPVLIGLMIYLNSLVVMLGAIGTFIIGNIKCALLFIEGDMELFNYGILILAGFFIGIIGSYLAITLLIKFGQEDQSVIEQEMVRRQETAAVINQIVNQLDADFKEIVDSLHVINEAMGSADAAMDDISGSSESTALAVGNQADMTTHIQESLETADTLAVNAKDTTENLKEVIVEGKNRANDLQMQSDLVDQNIIKISQTVDQLVENVMQVSGITESILNISSQTNLLALNASIEAARAGDAGKGFAVVADEIRNLAEETKVCTEQITEIITKLTAVTNQTKVGIDESTESINLQRQRVEEMNASFTQIESGMFELRDGVLNMAQEVETVLSANRKIVDSISILSAASQEVSAGTQTCRTTIGKAFENLGKFSNNVDNTFEQLHILKQTADSSN